MAEDALRSTSLKANFHRLTRLLMRGGVNLLRETFDSIHSPADLHLRLADPAIQVQLRGARLTQQERNCLYPSPGVYGKSNDFDITLIFKLLRTICNLTPPPGPRGWDDLPNGSDHTLVADLVRIKYYRNEIHGHRHSMEISDTEFLRLWKEISEALLRITANISPAKRDEWKKSIDDLLRKPLTPDEERCIKELETWYMQDLEVKNEVVQLTEKVELLTAAVLVILLNVLGHNQAAGSELLLPVPEQAERADDPEANNPLLPEPEQAAGADDPEPNNPPDIDVWDVILSFKEAVDLFLRYLSSKLHLRVRNKGKGSWHITVECSSSQVLEGLWEDYRSGHLNSVAQEMLVTQQVLEKLGRTELKLKTFISEDQYEKGKKLLEASSGDEDKNEIQSASQAIITGAISEESIEPDLLAKISTLKRENVELKEKVKSFEEISQIVIDLLARISTLERENVELKEKVKAIEENFQSEREQTIFEAVKRFCRKRRALKDHPPVQWRKGSDSRAEILLPLPFIGVKQSWSNSGSHTSSLDKYRCTVDDELEDQLCESKDELRKKQILKQTSVAAKPFKVVVQPRHQQQKEGSRVEFKCNISGETEARYQWFKDDSKIQGQRNSSLVLDPVKVEDFGNYKCEVKYDDGDSEKCVTSLPAELDVIPSDGIKLKYLRDVDLNIKEKVGYLLTKKKPGTRTWKQLAINYAMEDLLIVSLERSQETAGKELIEFLATSNPKLTVYDLCKELKDKDIRRLDIVEVLSAHLSAPFSYGDVFL